MSSPCTLKGAVVIQVKPPVPLTGPLKKNTRSRTLIFHIISPICPLIITVDYKDNAQKIMLH